MEISRVVLLHVIFLLAFTPPTVKGISWHNKIGVLYSKDTERLRRVLKTVFQHVLPKILSPELKLSLVEVRTDGNDLLSKDVASKLSDVVSVIDLACKDEKTFALSSLLQVPMMKVDAIEDDTPHKFAMSIRPSYRVITQALFDLMDFFSFTRVAVVYDVRKSRQASHFYAHARRWPRFNIEMMPELLLHNKFKLQQALTVMLKSHIREIILFCDQKDLANIMNEALFVGFNDKSYKWITSDLEVAGPNRTYPAILGMLGLRLHLANMIAATDLEMDARGEGIEYSTAMYSAVHDAARVVGTAVQNLFISKGGKEMLATRHTDGQCPLQSQSNRYKGLGQRMLNETIKVKFQGVTGQVEFNRITGERRVQNGLDIINVLEKDAVKVGSWQPEPGANEHSVMVSSSDPPKWVGDFADFVKCHNPGSAGPTEAIGIPLLKITTVLEPPFVENKNKTATLPAGLIPKGMLHGFCIDLIEELSKQANFHYEIYLRKDKSYGGMVEELKDQTMDIALAPITITADRELDIDFSKPFMDFSMSLIMQKPGDPPMNIFAFLQPFTGGVWLSTIGVVLFITVMMYVIDFLSPFGYRARARESDDEPGNEFNLFNSLWFATASVLQQGPDNTPLSPSGRLLGSTFWFFILILISTYTANLAAFFTIKQTADTINSLEALANQDEIKYGVLRGGSVRDFFENSENSLYRKMFSHMREYQTFVAGTSIGVQKARKESYAYITEYPYLEYYNQQKPCNTRLLNNLLQAKSYGIGLQRNSPYTNKISVAILKLRETNFIEKTRRKWWDERSQCPKPSQSKTGKTQSLDVNNLAGVFIILLGGVFISVILVIIEIRCKKLVVYLTNSQRALKRRFSREPRETTPRDPNNTQIRMGVVLSQGDRVLRPVEERVPEKATWRRLLGRE